MNTKPRRWNTKQASKRSNRWPKPLLGDDVQSELGWSPVRTRRNSDAASEMSCACTGELKDKPPSQSPLYTQELDMWLVATTPKRTKAKLAVASAQRRGEELETTKKWSAGQNKQHLVTKNTAKLDRETEELHHQRVPLEVGKVIQQGRQNKGMTQKDLATKVNEKPQIIADYECGRAIPNNQVMGKIERALGLKLRGKEVGLPLEAGPKKK
ncbi:UNVERIFIED_CONTAM: hypothetical protein FKN15_013921 [Acipenser sinensis]